jgi:hypothetical protein
MRGVVMVLVLVLAGCGGRELAWLVPRASIGLVLRHSDTGVTAGGYITLAAPLSGPQPRALRMPATPRPLHLLGPGPRCQVAPVCRWEAAARTEAITELTEEEAP